MKKVAMIGVGKLGQDCAEVMANHYDVIGYDVSPRTPENFNMASSIEEAVRDRDLIFIAAPTPHDPIYGGETPTSHLPNKDFDYTIVKDILEEVNKFVNTSQLVVLISTVLPGTVRNILRPLITNARFIYNPYLIAMGTVKWDMVNPEMVIIGTDDGSLTGDAKELIEFYKLFMENNPRYEVGTWDEAESIKIFYNTFISAKVGLVNMIQDVAEVNGNINVDVVTNALSKSTHRIMGPAYMTAGMGDGGACHPRDNIALRYLADRLDLGYDLFDAIMTAREKQAERMALKCLANGKRILIYGKAYKPNVPYLNGSSSMLVGYYIEKHGGELKYYDHNTGDTDTPTNWPDVILIGYWDDHTLRIIENFSNNVPTIIDPWRKYSEFRSSSDHTIIHYGDTRNSTKKKALRVNTGGWPQGLINDELAAWLDAEYRSKEDSFEHISVEDLVNQLIELKHNGYKKFIFSSCAETIRPKVLIKLDRVINKVRDIINPSDIYYLTGGYNHHLNNVSLQELYSLENNINTVYYSGCQQSYYENNNHIIYDTNEKDKTFLCFNKQPRGHRVHILEFLLANDLLDSGYVSFMADKDDPQFLHLTSHEKTPNIMHNLDKLPLLLNVPSMDINPINQQPGDIELFGNSYYSIVNETIFYKSRFPHYFNDIFISDKTWKAMWYKHPFIMVNRPYTLQALRHMGYKTFSPWIDESYDLIENDKERLEAIKLEIIRLSKLSDNDWIELRTNIREIIEHNAKLVTNLDVIKSTLLSGLGY